MKLTLEQLRKLGYVEHNGEWRKAGSPLGGLLSPQPKPNPLPALDQAPKRDRRRKRGVVVICTIIRCSGRILDSDNLQTAGKAIRDCIAKSLGLDDADPRIKWEYQQIQTRGRRGLIVKLERPEHYEHHNNISHAH